MAIRYPVFVKSVLQVGTSLRPLILILYDKDVWRFLVLF